MRQIFIVDATQVVVSDNHPEGAYSHIPNYPKTFDSRDYGASEQNPNGSEELALAVAEAEYYERKKQLALSTNREMWTVTLTRADGQSILKKSWGAFPDMTPPAPEPDEEPVEE